MKDSILKGTGNSRFLKSAVPAGTSWADALAMLQAGTFPIDFNGINTEGFQQVGTPLNKANLLKDVNALTLGLTGDAVPNDMFNVLAHAGDLHVWRKTVVNSDPVPASYTLGAAGAVALVSGSVSAGMGSSTKVNVSVTDSISVSDDGTIIPGVATTYYTYPGYATTSYVTLTRDAIVGKFIFVSSIGASVQLEDAKISEIYYAASNVSFSDRTSDDRRYVDVYNLQKVIGTPAIPAGTTVTYPVSTNRNAYQEGSDAKPAGYTLGDVVTGSFKMSERYPTDGYYYKYANSISVADNGIVSLDNPSQISFDRYNGGQSYADRNLAGIAGKFIYLANRDSGTNAPDSKPPFNSVPSAVVYIPSDAALTWTEGGALDGFTLSRYQPVTGYAAIPAGTTIEYLGKLGDKARVQVVSYVGTGTYGVDNKNQLTFSEKPRFVMVPGAPFGYAYIPEGAFYYALVGNYVTLENLNCVWEDDTNTMTWYHPSFSYRQYNRSGTKYTFVAIY